ncbi:MAG: tetratricopeptide repeat protein [Bacteroidota bacterium]
MSPRAGIPLPTICRRTAFCLLIPLLPLVFASCSVTDFVGAYFNTYYNARRLFTEAETETFAQADSRPGGRNYLAPFTISAGTKAKFTSVIEKCSKLLQYHPESSLVDDALMMIGKAYYYQDEDQSAARKYRELIEGYPGGGLKLEAELYLAYAQYRMNAREGARATALLLAEEAGNEGEEGLLARASSVLGEIAVGEKDYASARGYFETAAEHGGTASQRAASWMQVGTMYSRMGKYSEAQAAFEKAEGESDTYGGEYRGRMGEIRMLAKQGEYDRARAGLEELRQSSNNREFFGEIDLEIGHVYREMGDFTAAREQYVYVDTTYARTENAANAYYALGNLYENVLFRYDLALPAYIKARSEYPLASITLDAARRSDYLGKYFQYVREIAKYDSIRALMHSADTSHAAHLDTASTGAGKDSVRTSAPPPPAMSLESVEEKLASNENELAGLFYATIGLPDSAERRYRNVVAIRPDGPLVPRALFTLAQIYSRDTTGSRGRVDSIYHAIIERFPGSEFAAESRRLLGLPVQKQILDPAEQSYTLGESLMVAGKNLAAIATFRTIVERYPASPFSSRALYAAGWLYENELDRPDSALATYERLITRYPASPYAVKVQPRMIEAKSPGKSQSAADSTELERSADRRLGTIDDEVVRGKRRTVPDTPAGQRPQGEPKKPAETERPDLE